MGIVSDYIIKLVRQQVEKRGVVLWCDPHGLYGELAAGLALPDTRVARFGGSFLALRREINGLLNDVDGDMPPRLVVYYPADLSDADHALDEIAFAGVLMGPDAHKPCNTRLEVVAREALRPFVPPEKLNELLAQVQAGQIATLAELDRVAEQTGGPGLGVLRLIFGTEQAGEIALRFLSDPALDAALVKKAALPQLAGLFAATFGLDVLPDQAPDKMRAQWSKQLLLAELAASVAGPLPAPLAGRSMPEDSAREAAAEFVRGWRNRRDLSASYAQAATAAERDNGLQALDWDWPALRSAETFPFVEPTLQSGVERALLAGPAAASADDWLALAEKRQATFWSEAEPTLRARWALISTAGHLLRQASEIKAELKSRPPATAAGYVERYTTGAAAWCQLDTYQRIMERLAQNFDFDAHGAHASLEQLLARARQAYTTVADELARRFVQALAQESYSLAGCEYQTEVFRRYVAPAIEAGKTAYVLVDALRFEMARELAASLSNGWQATLIPAIGTPPTITPVGMAALLPGAERGLAIVETGRGIAPEIAGQVLKDRKDRIKYLNSKVSRLVDVKLEELVPARKAVREKVREAGVVLVTSQEIDLLGEGDSPAQAREFMDSALGKLARAFRTLADLGVQRIIVAADHGYVFGEELDTDVTFEAPGGQTAELHRRVWVGRGGDAHDQVARVSAAALGLGGELELATPYGLAAFAAPGGRAYFHGGLALQELIVPVLVLQPVAQAVTAAIEWTLTPGSQKLSSRFFSVTVGGRVQGMFEAGHPRVRVEVRARTKAISVPAASTYGFQDGTGEVEMRLRPGDSQELEPNTVMLQITGETDQKTVSVALLEGDREVKSLDRIEVAITF